MENKNCCCSVDKQKSTPRSSKEEKDLENRLNRIIGQLEGIKNMLANNRYCGDILNQVIASEKALDKVAMIILKTHLKTCVHDDLLKGKEEIIDETITLLERLK